MKKFSKSKSRPILSCVLATVSTTCAYAQQVPSSSDSVQFYGLIDAGVGSFKDAGGSRSSQLSPGNMTTDYFGFRGREDLGSGLYAQFIMEAKQSLDQAIAYDAMVARIRARADRGDMVEEVLEHMPVPVGFSSVNAVRWRRVVISGFEEIDLRRNLGLGLPGDN